MSASLPRRDLLRLAGVAVTGVALAACTTSPGSGPSTASPGSPDDPDRALRSEVAADEAALSDLYAAAARALPAALSTTVSALGARHAAYRGAVVGGATVSATSTPSTPSAASTASASAGSTATWLARLRTAEAKASAARAAQSVRATDAELARTIVLAGTGAAGASEVLRGLA